MGIKFAIRKIPARVDLAPTGGECDRCGKELVLVFPDTPTRQMMGGSYVTMHGYYGGFIDPLSAEDPEWLLCAECSGEIWKWLGIPSKGYMAKGYLASGEEE